MFIAFFWQLLPDIHLPYLQIVHPLHSPNLFLSFEFPGGAIYSTYEGITLESSMLLWQQQSINDFTATPLRYFSP